MKLHKAIERITPVDNQAMTAAKMRWNSIAKPLDSLGLLEDAVVRIAGITGSSNVSLVKKCLVIMCADNGVVAQGVTQAGSEITAIVTENFADGRSCVCAMANKAGVRVYPVDIGVQRDIDHPGVINKKIMYGTRDLSIEPAMTKQQALAAVETGIEMAFEMKRQGYSIMATGEMGIGNTTTSSALGAVLFDKPAHEVTGCGSGLSEEGLKRKISVIKRAIALHEPSPEQPMDVLSKLGGLDIAGITGLFIGGAACRLPVVIDGVISSIASYLAVQIDPEFTDYMLASHFSKEPLGIIALQKLGLKPMITCEMGLGEGTGAVAALSLLDLGLSVYNDMCSFSETGIEQYMEFK